jgi:hypothetical protein
MEYGENYTLKSCLYNLYSSHDGLMRWVKHADLIVDIRY